MDIIPRSVFRVTDSDNKIELSVVPTSMFALKDGAAARNNILGIHLQYKTEITMIDEYNSTIVNVEDKEIHPSKRLKHTGSDKMTD